MRVQAEPTDIFVKVEGVDCRVWNAVTESGEQVFLFVCRVAVPDAGRNGLIFEQELIEKPAPRIEPAGEVET